MVNRGETNLMKNDKTLKNIVFKYIKKTKPIKDMFMNKSE